MGTRYDQHSDLCGCERCAVQADRENPQPVFDAVEDPNILDCGCDAFRGCDCALYDDFDEDSDDPCDHDDREVDILTGRASCWHCGEAWTLTSAELEAELKAHAMLCQQIQDEETRP